MSARFWGRPPPLPKYHKPPILVHTTPRFVHEPTAFCHRSLSLGETFRIGVSARTFVGFWRDERSLFFARDKPRTKVVVAWTKWGTVRVCHLFAVGGVGPGELRTKLGGP